MIDLREADVQALRLMYGGGHGAWAVAMTAATIVGEGWSALLLLPLLAHVRTRQFAAPLAAAVAAQAVLVWALKAAFGRVRPWIALGLPAPIGAPHDPSFPSGHAAGAFCVAAFLAVALPTAWPSTPRRARLVGAGGIVAAGLIASSRVYLGCHFPSDVLAGAVLGGGLGAYAAGQYVRSRGAG